jgi:hydrogenase maturation factor
MNVDNEREGEINFVLNMTDKICREFNIALVPKKLKNGQYVVGILDGKTGKEYVMLKNEEGKDERKDI